MDRDECIVVTWRLENYNFNFLRGPRSYFSPFFKIDSVKDTSWYLELYPDSTSWKEDISFYVRRTGGTKFDYRIHYKISFFADDSFSPLYEGSSHLNPAFTSSKACFAPHHKVHIQKRGIFFPPKTLIIRCRMYKDSGSFSDAGHCFVRTRFRVERTSFIGLAEKFSSLLPNEKKILLIKTFSTEEKLFNLSLNLAGGLCCKERVWIEIIPTKKDYIKFCKCKLFLLDSEGAETECGRGEILFCDLEQEICKFPLKFTRSSLMKKNTQFLLNDILTLKFEFAFSTGIEYEKIEGSEFGKLATVNQSCKLPSALEEITYLYKDGILCDMKLRTETETFSVHKNILSARSSVFKAMFTTDMREKTTDCVIIEDLEAKTVHRMLLYLYSDELEDLDLEDAKSLYFAADKYNIIGLKQRCSGFLKSILQKTNCCEIFLLADKHQDREMKKYVQEYISDYHEEIFRSEEWKNFEKINPELSIETFHAVYLGN